MLVLIATIKIWHPVVEKGMAINYFPLQKVYLHSTTTEAALKRKCSTLWRASCLEFQPSSTQTTSALIIYFIGTLIAVVVHLKGWCSLRCLNQQLSCFLSFTTVAKRILKIAAFQELRLCVCSVVSKVTQYLFTLDLCVLFLWEGQFSPALQPRPYNITPACHCSYFPILAEKHFSFIVPLNVTSGSVWNKPGNPVQAGWLHYS